MAFMRSTESSTPYRCYIPAGCMHMSACLPRNPSSSLHTKYQYVITYKTVVTPRKKGTLAFAPPAQGR